MTAAAPALSSTVATVLQRLTGVQRRADGWMAKCPSHDDRQQSLAIAEGTDGRALLTCHAGCDVRAIVAAVGLTMQDLFPPKGLQEPALGVVRGGQAKGGRIVETYRYVNEDGQLLFEVVRKEPKAFPQRRPDPTQPGGWSWKLGDVRRVLYHLPELLAGVAARRAVLVVEGEKDVHTLERAGFVATTNPGGAGKWRPEFARTLEGARVVLLPDNDDAGRQHMHDVAATLVGLARELRLVELPGLGPKGDVSDWFAGGGSAEQLQQLIRAAPLYAPATHDADTTATPGTSAGESADRVGDEVDLSHALYSDDALALGFSAEVDLELRYTDAWKRFYRFDGTRFVEDERQWVFARVRQYLREVSQRADKPSVRKELQSAQKVNAVLQMVRADQRHAVGVKEWDTDPMLLATPGGVVDLTTGETRSATAADLLTKATAVAPGGDCPRFLALVRWALNEDEELIHFVQRVFGYGLTGSTREQSIFFCHGSGGNGKGSILNACAGAMGDYAVTAPMSTFLHSTNDSHPTDLATLRGARLVVAQESQEGRKWDESRLKALTGGDPISARFMRGDFFEYIPQFTLILASNHKPSLTTVDDAIRRRFHLIPFVRKVTAAEKDPHLSDRLRAERAGILAWMIEGAVRWQREGLRPPASVQAATDAYLAAEDSLETWLAECCERSPSAWTPVSSLFTSWGRWADANGERPGNTKRFSEAMRAHGLEPVRMGKARTRAFLGIRLLDAVGGDHAAG